MLPNSGDDIAPPVSTTSGPKPSERQSRVERQLRMEIYRLASERSLAKSRRSANLKQEPFSVNRRAWAKH